MPVAVQVIGAIIGLGFAAMVLFAAVYIADDLERTSLRPLGRFLKAIVGGLLWAVVGVFVSALLFLLAIIVHYIFFRPLFSYAILQFWAIRAALVIIGLYILWGLYHGARNRLPLSYKYGRSEPDLLNNEL
jgi:hypothetical protein